MNFDTLKKDNPHIHFVSLKMNPCSHLYQKHSIDASEIVALSDKLVCQNFNQYIASDCEAEKLQVVNTISRNVFAEADIQAGWCFGCGKTMNGVEWHKSSETIVACTDMVLILGNYFDILENKYDTKNAFGLFMQKGDVVELYPLTLHLAPLAIDKNFKAAILLPRKTNTPLKGGIDGVLRANNKWLLVHAENMQGIEQGGKIGVIGENLKIN